MLLAAAGFLSGILSGMGVGGGMILIPVLTIFAGASQHTAQTVNLYYFIPSAAAALVVHIILKPKPRSRWLYAALRSPLWGHILRSGFRRAFWESSLQRLYLYSAAVKYLSL